MHEGRLPFQAATPLALMRKHETEPPPPLGGDVPAAVAEIVERCLAKRPEDRYQTPRELVQALRTALDLPGAITPLATPVAAPTIRQAHDSDADAVVPTLAMANGTAPGRTAAPTLPAAQPAPATAPAALPAAHRRSGPLLLLAAVGAVLVLGAAATAILLRARDDGGPDPASSGSAGDIASATPGAASPAATAAPTPSPPRLLLTPGERISLASVPAIELPVPICPGVKTVLRLTYMLAEPDGRLTIGFSFEIPRIADVECPNLAYDPDANCCSALLTRRATGPPVEARVNGGSGLALAGAEDVYGQPERSGSWVFPNVELDGEDLTLVRYSRSDRGPFAGSTLFQVVLIQRR
jgi:hypothetical protein